MNKLAYERMRDFLEQLRLDRHWRASTRCSIAPEPAICQPSPFSISFSRPNSQSAANAASQCV